MGITGKKTESIIMGYIGPGIWGRWGSYYLKRGCSTSPWSPQRQQRPVLMRDFSNASAHAFFVDLRMRSFALCRITGL